MQRANLSREAVFRALGGCADPASGSAAASSAGAEVDACEDRAGVAEGFGRRAFRVGGGERVRGAVAELIAEVEAT